MILRNGKRIGNESKQLYSNTIDFDYASWAWRLNKISIGYGQFVYT
jgi:hypothetical protein